MTNYIEGEQEEQRIIVENSINQDKYTDEDIKKLYGEFGKIQIVNINKGQKGKHAIH